MPWYKLIIMMVLTIFASVIIVPGLLYVIGAPHYALYTAFTSFFGAPLQFVMFLFAYQGYKWVRTGSDKYKIQSPNNLNRYKKIIYTSALVIGLLLAYVGRNDVWENTFHQVVVVLLITIGTYGLVGHSIMSEYE